MLCCLLSFLWSNNCFSNQVRGIWVECQGSNDTLSTPNKIREMVDFADKSGSNTIYLQVYRHNRSWYYSKLADKTPFTRIWKKYKTDPLAYTIKLAHKKGIKVHAWVNVFRIGKDKKAPIIMKLGEDIITRNGKGKSMLKYSKDQLPDGGYWLDPGDPAVQDYNLEIIREIIYRYPGVDGIHLDFVRYPYSNINPGSKWSEKKDFGYSKEAVKRFEAVHGFSPINMNLKDKNKTQLWDKWRREQVGAFVLRAKKLCKNNNKNIIVSTAVQPWADRAYMVAYQDWRLWMEKGILDYVVLMNYTDDRRLARYLSQTAVNTKTKGDAYIGLGAYKMTDGPNNLYNQIKDCQSLRAKGIVLFSYDAMLKNKRIFTDIGKKNWW